MLHTVTGIVDPGVLKGDETTGPTPHPHYPSAIRERKEKSGKTSSVKIRLMMFYAAMRNSWAAGDGGVENV